MGIWEGKSAPPVLPHRGQGRRGVHERDELERRAAGACMHKAALTWCCMGHYANTLRKQAGMKTPSSLRGAQAPGYAPISASLFHGMRRPTRFACRRRCCLACVIPGCAAHGALHARSQVIWNPPLSTMDRRAIRRCPPLRASTFWATRRAFTHPRLPTADAAAGAGPEIVCATVPGLSSCAWPCCAYSRRRCCRVLLSLMLCRSIGSTTCGLRWNESAQPLSSCKE